MNLLRRQLPAYSPLSGAAVWRGVLRSARSPDPRASLVEHLSGAYNADAVLLCGSGTQALQLGLEVAFQVLGSRPTVAVPAFTCFGVATAAVGADARIALYDVVPTTLAPDLDSLRRALREGARVVVVSPLYGVPIDWAQVEQCTAPFGAIVVEDAAQGHGASWLDRAVGSLGNASILSFARGKGWTGGRGGALLLRGHAAGHAPPGPTGEGGEAKVALTTGAQWVLGRPRYYGIPAAIPWLHLGETLYYDPEPLGPMTRMAARVLHATREAAAVEAAQRRHNAAVFRNQVAFGPRVRPVDPPAGAGAGFLRFPVLVNGGLAALPSPATRLGIAPTYPHPLSDLPAVHARASRTPDELPGAVELARDLVTLPTHSLVTVEEQRAIVALLSDAGRPEPVRRPSGTRR